MLNKQDGSFTDKLDEMHVFINIFFQRLYAHDSNVDPLPKISLVQPKVSTKMNGDSMLTVYQPGD